MVRVVFGQGVPTQGELAVDALTVGELWTALAEQRPELSADGVRLFVNGHDVRRAEGDLTPLGDEDTVLVAVWPLPE